MTSACCTSSDLQSVTIQSEQAPAWWADGLVQTATGPVGRVRTELDSADRLGSWKARWGIGRMHYLIAPGLYAVGSPTVEAPVLVSANYKMSFDRLRSQLGGRDIWIMVIDTKGINVWCAAGKGTFCAEEIDRCIRAVRLDEVVSHRTLILPQLSAPGVKAHRVKELSGFRVVYGPVRAKDLPAFLDAGLKATPEMRQVRFVLADRVMLIPMELVLWGKYLIFAALCLFLLAGLGRDGYSSARVTSVGLTSVALLVAGYLAGAVLGPILLPWLPGRAFSVKGLSIGLALAVGVAIWSWPLPGVFGNWFAAIGWLLMIPAVTSFVTMNFTGVSTYTSLSGVRREMAVAVPLQVIGAVGGLALWLAGRFV